MHKRVQESWAGGSAWQGPCALQVRRVSALGGRRAGSRGLEANGLQRTGPRGDERYLLTLNTLQGVLFLIAGHAEVLVVFRDEALGADGLLAAAADEAGLVPAAVLVLHLAGTCHESREEAAES